MLWLLHPSWSRAVAVAWTPSPDGSREEELACPLLMLGGGAALAIIAVVTMLLNLLLIFAILVNRQSRSRSFPLHIVNLAASGILQVLYRSGSVFTKSETVVYQGKNIMSP